jgi:hypothetical protein
MIRLSIPLSYNWSNLPKLLIKILCAFRNAPRLFFLSGPWFISVVMSAEEYTCSCSSPLMPRVPHRKTFASALCPQYLLPVLFPQRDIKFYTDKNKKLDLLTWQGNVKNTEAYGKIHFPPLRFYINFTIFWWQDISIGLFFLLLFWCYFYIFFVIFIFLLNLFIRYNNPNSLELLYPTFWPGYTLQLTWLM